MYLFNKIEKFEIKYINLVIFLYINYFNSDKLSKG